MTTFFIPLQAPTTATSTQSSAPIRLDPQLWDAIRYWADCSDEDEEEAAAYVRKLLDEQKKGTNPWQPTP